MRKLFFAFASAFAGRARDDKELDGVAHLATGLATYVGPLCFVRRSSREALADLLAQRDEISAKCWSEWQVLNLRPLVPNEASSVRSSISYLLPTSSTAGRNWRSRAAAPRRANRVETRGISLHSKYCATYLGSHHRA